MKKFLVPVQAVSYTPTGMTGATAATRYVGGTTSGAPSSGTFSTGDWVVTQDGHIKVCTAGGSPGTWADVGTASGVSSVAGRTGAVTLTLADIAPGTATGTSAYNFSGPVLATAPALGTSAGNLQEAFVAGHSGPSNSMKLVTQFRRAVAGSDWTSETLWLLRRVDVTDQAGLEFGQSSIQTLDGTTFAIRGDQANHLLLNDTHSGQATPKKYLRSQGGSLQVLNDAASTAILSLTDAGALSVPSTIVSGTNTAAGAVYANGPAGQGRGYLVQTAGSNRWFFGGNAIAEGGSNSGSNFGIFGYADDGTTLLGPYLSIVRSSGVVSIPGTLTLSGDQTNHLLLSDTHAAQTTPKKYLRSLGGQFQIVNDGNTAIIMSLTDAGVLTPLGSIQVLANQSVVFNTSGPTDFGEMKGTADGNLDIRTTANGMRWVNHAYDTVIATLSNTGAFVAAGSILSTAGVLATNTGTGAARVRYVTGEGNTGAYIDLWGGVTVAGRSDQTTLTVQMNAAQTADVLRLIDSASAALLYVDSAGDLHLPGSGQGGAYGLLASSSLIFENTTAATSGNPAQIPGGLNWQGKYWTGSVSSAWQASAYVTIDAGPLPRLYFDGTGGIDGKDLKVNNVSVSRGRTAGVAEAVLTAQTVAAASAGTNALVTGMSDISVAVVSGRRYRITVKIPIAVTVTLDQLEFSLVANGASAPTTGSTIVQVFRTPAIGGTAVGHFILVFEVTGGGSNAAGQLASGTNRIGLLCKRANGTGGWTLNHATYKSCFEFEDIST